MKPIAFVAAVGVLILANIAAAQNGPAPASQSAATRSATATCIAMALPTVQGATGSATDVASGIRDLFTSYLHGPSMKVLPLEAKLSSQAAEEAKNKSCDNLLVVAFTRKQGGGGGILGRALGQAGTTAAWQIPGGGVGAAVARGAAAAGAQAASDMAAGTRAKDEMRLEYRIVSTGGRTVLKTTEQKAKASVDGEDLLTPLVQRASESIATALSR